MAGYTKVVRSIWQDDDFRALGATTQRMYFMLISQPDLSQCGVLATTPGRWAALAADTEAADMRAEMAALEAAGFIVIDPATEELWVRSYMKYDEGHKVPNIAKAVVSACEAVSSRSLRRLIAAAARTLGVTLPETLSRTLGESLQPTPAAIPTAAAAAQPPDESVDDFDGAVTHPLAAAALSMMLAWKCSTARNPGGLRKKLRTELPIEHNVTIAAYLARNPAATAEDIARDVLKVPGVAPAAVTPTAPDWYANPHCETCDGDGLANLAPEGAPAAYGPCDCRRSEPYPEPLASVHELRPA